MSQVEQNAQLCMDISTVSCIKLPMLCLNEAKYVRSSVSDVAVNLTPHDSLTESVSVAMPQ